MKLIALVLLAGSLGAQTKPNLPADKPCPADYHFAYVNSVEVCAPRNTDDKRKPKAVPRPQMNGDVIVPDSKVVAVVQTKPADKPLDVPPIMEEYGNLGYQVCDMGACIFNETNTPGYPGMKLYRRTRLTCAEKTRFLMTAEDGSQHCIALVPAPTK